jgi:hypothetical protein
MEFQVYGHSGYVDKKHCPDRIEVVVSRSNSHGNKIPKGMVEMLVVFLEFLDFPKGIYNFIMGSTASSSGEQPGTIKVAVGSETDNKVKMKITCGTSFGDSTWCYLNLNEAVCVSKGVKLEEMQSLMKSKDTGSTGILFNKKATRARLRVQQSEEKNSNPQVFEVCHNQEEE